MYYGKGFIHSDVYDMPIYLRNFYYKQLLDTRKKESDEMKKAQQISKPKLNPRYKREFFTYLIFIYEYDYLIRRVMCRRKNHI